MLLRTFLDASSASAFASRRIKNKEKSATVGFFHASIHTTRKTRTVNLFESNKARRQIFYALAVKTLTVNVF
jgi:hypothetical protein